MDFSDLKANLRKDFSGLRKVKIALLGDATLQFLAMALRGYGYEIGIDLAIYEAPYGQLASDVLDEASQLYEFKPEFILIFHTSFKLLEKFYALNNEEKLHFSHQQIVQIKEYYYALSSQNSSVKIIYANFTEILENTFGNYANKLNVSFEYQLRKLNVDLMNLSHELPNFYINDISRLQAYHGLKKFFDARMYITSDLIYSLQILPSIAKNTLTIIHALQGHFKKCLILDLDNTLWGGVIGDDGIQGIEIGHFGIGKAYSRFQAWIKQLKNRGIILAVCSQNHEATAKRPFLEHPEMILKLSDLSLFVANWESKVDNIKYIQQVLNINLNSMVFIDDDPYQRHLVKTYLPEINVPELPKDPVDYVDFLAELNLFEVANYSAEDQHRGQYYQDELNRIEWKKTFADEKNYLLNLQMTADILPFNTFTLPRILQLLQRSNQFNLRTIRYTEKELQHMMHAPDIFPMAFALQDKFGHYGIVSVAILKVHSDQEYSIDTWLMSCRVLKRGLENLVLACMVNIAKNNGYKRLIGEYVPTDKNHLVRDHYQKMGFKPHLDKWHLHVDHYAPDTYFIELKGWEDYAKGGFAISN